MSAEIQMSTVDDAVDFPYRAISRAAVFSIIFFVIALLGLVPSFEFALILAVPGIISACFALKSISTYPDEFSGRNLALFGLVANIGVLAAGIGIHSYIYMTEVPEGYQRVNFWELQQAQDRPDGPTTLAYEIDGKQVFLKGYIHPSSGAGKLKEFILVPDLGTCCFGGQPRSSDMLEVKLLGGQTLTANYRKRKLAGTFKLNKAPMKLTDFENQVFYRMQADQAK